MARLVACVVALAVGIGGLIPRWTAYRCVIMQRVSSHACCPEHEDDGPVVGAACCDGFAAPSPADRIGPRVAQPSIHPAPLAGLVPIAPVLPAVSPSLLARADAAPPPGRSILSLGSVLRI